MIEREITPYLLSLFGQYPVVTVTGPRQSGKTTLCRSAFADLAYANLEDPDAREFAESDPRRFLAQFGDGAVLDEIQRVPSLLSYIQVIVDEDRRNGQFVLTGSEQFGMTSTISQSLAGRTALLRLLPFTLAECRLAGASGAVDKILYTGGYPRIHDQRLNPTQALADYQVTYVERDAQRIGGIRDLAAFRRFVRLCAGRVGQLVNLSSLGADAGVSQPTARQWLSVLESSDIVFRLPPHHTNIRKRLTKAPKLYFVDVGLASYLIGIRSPEQLAAHPLRGPLFENAAVSEAVKRSHNHARYAELSFFRTADGLECDLLHPTPAGLAAIEVKSGATLTGAWFAALRRIQRTIPGVAATVIVYGGDRSQTRSGATAVPLAQLSAHLAALDGKPAA
ncbi:MAG: ATP-binding protein [Acidimicrobiaceae bacterium]|nr:ATP-binding protein [Acidimicrobiaceae bacterium]MYE75808.1 ATP-binding protein [Acidimicrobiaceae bacterium]MYE96096.1 ATP-binding protein [Acidimicrobiaceae bacterium]MYH44405.1 ATP-binding protein [Acidimicrobiaceae bacterium]MYI53870.1 ATP-binding protein [Acidimicrobiaceae bacterium]